MTTAQDVFDAAMAIIDEVNSATGSTDTIDTAEYKSRTLLILNVLRGELYPYSDTFVVITPGVRPISERITDFSVAINLDDYICQSVMPYGLAAHLLLDENPSSADFCQQRYDELKVGLSKGIPTISADIIDVYGANGGLSPYNEFGMWS